MSLDKEWEKEMMRLPKKELVKLYKERCKKIQELTQTIRAVMEVIYESK